MKKDKNVSFCSNVISFVTLCYREYLRLKTFKKLCLKQVHCWEREERKLEKIFLNLFNILICFKIFAEIKGVRLA